jgi:hypothetical protein
MIITTLILMSQMETGMCLANAATEGDDFKMRKKPTG